MGLTVDDVDFDLDVLLVLGKGRRERALPFGRKSAVVLDRQGIPFQAPGGRIVKVSGCDTNQVSLKRIDRI